MPARDTELDVSPSSVPLVANGNSAVETIYGTPITGLAVAVHINACNAGPTLSVIVHGSTSTADPTTDSQIVGQLNGITAEAGYHIVPFIAPRSRAILVEYAITSATSDTPNFSDVEGYIVENVGGEWTRLNIPV